MPAGNDLKIKFTQNGVACDVEFRPEEVATPDSVTLDGRSYELRGSELGILWVKLALLKVSAPSDRTLEGLKIFLLEMGAEEIDDLGRLQSVATQTLGTQASDNKKLGSKVNAEALALRDVIETHGMKALLEAVPYIDHFDFTGLSAEDFTEIMQIISDTKVNEHISYLDVTGHNCESLPALPNCLSLKCSKCPRLSNLPALPSCRLLYCYNCPSLQALPALPSCRLLCCQNCPSLRALPALPSCKDLLCANCPVLRALPDLPECKYLQCSDNPGLRALPALPLCEDLRCSNCPGLAVVSSLPMAHHFLTEGSPIQSIIQQPVYSRPILYLNYTRLLEAAYDRVATIVEQEGIEPTTQQRIALLISEVRDLEMYVLSDAIGTHTQELLTELARTVTQIGKLPTTYYLDSNGEKSEAIDAGAVGRDFLTRLMEAVAFSEGRQALGIVDGLPNLSESDSNEASKYFEAMGVLMALCYKGDSSAKTGPLFTEKAYEAISFDLSTEEGSIRAYVSTFANLPHELSTLCSQENPKLDTLFPQAERQQRINEVLTSATYLMEEEEELSSIQVFNEKGTRQKLREALLQRSKEHTVIAALTSISKGMKAFLDPSSWEDLIQRKGIAISERIQGKLSAEDLINALEWNPGVGVDTDKKKQMQLYMQAWIQSAAPDTLLSFMRAVTGTRTLVPHQPPLICIDDTDQNTLPVSQSCFSRLDMSANYSSQERFNEAMKEFLANALEGTGFQLS